VEPFGLFVQLCKTKRLPKKLEVYCNSGCLYVCSRTKQACIAAQVQMGPTTMGSEREGGGAPTHLQSSVHLQKVKLPILVYHEF
jgi:hypothetical protein